MKLTQSVFSAYYSAKNSVQNFLKREDGVTAIEYAIVAAGVAAVVVVLFQSDGAFAKSMKEIFNRLSTQLDTLLPGSGSGTGGTGGTGGATS
ncbi:Flp family type IVb pilin [Frischella perrara]|uniref:Flp family type IVb pilin n=1 Tax=Frischella perrara TaxID=1267021 RepID=UPI0023F443FE|nr:Flp family type IVb pilin [Frischella perrara]MCT6875416.1 Flp family type IVb pilin [Frischella perrara]